MPKQLWFGLFPVRSPLLRESLLFSLPPGTKMFQFPGFASSRFLGRISRLQRDGLPHSEICGCIGYLLLPAAYRSLSRPSSPLRAKAFTMRPFFIFSNIILLIFHFLPVCQRTFVRRSFSEGGFFNPFRFLFSRDTPPLLKLRRAMVENKGVEPLTPCVQGRCSGQLS